MKNNTKFTSIELINMYTGSNKGNRNSELNYNRLTASGITPNTPIELENNISVVFFPRHGGIEKSYFWGSRSIKKATALSRIKL